MAVFIELTTDAFADQMKKYDSAYTARQRAGASSARRPLRGLEIKDDTYAMLRVVQPDGTELPLINSSTPEGTGVDYTNFILQNVQEARMEKHQIVETFGEPYIFFFGESPRFIDVQAVLINSNDFNWEAEWWENYDKYLRGTKLVEMGARCYLFYDDNIVEGYILQATAVKNSMQPLSVGLQFRMFLTSYTNISFIGDPAFPTRTDLQLVSQGEGAAVHKPDPVSNLAQVPPLWEWHDSWSLPHQPEQVIQSDNVSPPGVSAKPVRDSIVRNVDEWTGFSPFDTEGRPDLTDPTKLNDRKLSDSSNLPNSLFAWSKHYGADGLTGTNMLSLGVGPSFGYSSNGKSLKDMVSDVRSGYESAKETITSLPRNARDTYHQTYNNIRATLKTGKDKLQGGLNAVQDAVSNPGGTAKAGWDYIYNAPLSSGQSGTVATFGGSAGIRVSAGAGAGGSISTTGKASAFALVVVSGTFNASAGVRLTLADEGFEASARVRASGSIL